jgi:nitrate/TMAO reductase-like tetraheme cytochrome c subunit
VLVLLFLLWLLTTPLFATEATPHFHPPHPFAKIWARSIAFSMVAAASLLIIYTLTFRQQYLQKASSKWMLFTGICLLPTPVMLLSTAVGLEQSKNVEFCMSCHVMKPFIDDMRNPTNKTLAALHYKNRYIQREQCYNCHTDYGILGTMEAKMTGLRHILKAGTGSYTLPIKMAKPYDFSICLDCHANSAKFDKEAAHDGVVKETMTHKSSCLACHDSPHPPPETRSKE